MGPIRSSLNRSKVAKDKHVIRLLEQNRRVSLQRVTGTRYMYYQYFVASAPAPAPVPPAAAAAAVNGSLALLLTCTLLHHLVFTTVTTLTIV